MRTLLAPPPVGTVVRCWFPESESVMVPGPKFRPVLVLAVDDESSRVPRVLVAYGTSQHTERNALGEFLAPRSLVPELECDTKFCLKQAFWLPLTREYFAARGRQSVPVVLPTRLHSVLLRAYHEAQ